MGELDLAFREIADKRLRGDDLERALLDVVRDFGIPFDLAMDYWEEWQTVNRMPYFSGTKYGTMR